MKLYSFFTITILAFFLLYWQDINRENPSSAIPTTKEELGKLLFEDKILSSDYSISCTSCHIPAFAFADTSALSLGVNKKLGERNTPSAMNMLSRTHFFWDGRSSSLEEQALIPIENPDEMNLPLDEAILRLNQNSFYLEAFRRIYNEKPNKINLADALASFEKTLETLSPYDEYKAGNLKAISESAIRGIDIFNVKGKCFDCHFGPDLTGDEFRNIGLFEAGGNSDPGRYKHTKDSTDLGKFKVPSLRNVSVTAPYMHDGSFKTLREVVDYYNKPDQFRPVHYNRDTLLNQPLGLSEQEILDLIAFMEALTAPQYLHLIQK
jgi:cytochrome c peroxidase